MTGIDTLNEQPKGDIDAPRPFVPTPERVSQYLEMSIDEVAAALKSVEGRQRLFESLLRHEDDLRVLDPQFEPAVLREQLDLVADVFHEKERYLLDMQQPEKQGAFRRAWERVKGFAKRHPVVTTLLVAALVASGVAAGFYVTGNWELLLTKVGLDKILGGAEAAGEMMDPTLVTPLPPGAGELAVPPPATAVPGASGPI
ncbi:MAG: hypothetical protein WCX29_00425 [Candidatus Peribacteraceae bacterium]|jgi:hypothetical protein